jgi:hypothetical protein
MPEHKPVIILCKGNSLAGSEGNNCYNGPDLEPGIDFNPQTLR